MTVGKVLTKLRLSFAVCVLLVVTAGIMAGSASAQPPSDWSGLPANSPAFNPLNTNVPYLAWRGEEVRLVKCVADLPLLQLTAQTNSGFFWGPDVSMQIFAYSGPQENSFDGPKAVQNSASIFFSREKGPCVRATFVSNKAGIVVIKLSVAIRGVQLAVHDFVIGWMAINGPTITNPGDVTEDAGFEPGNSVNVSVKGSIPLNSEFQEDFGLPASLTMPDDWALWANQMATTDGAMGGPGSPPASAFWDIHDSSGPLGNESPDGSPDVHVNQDSCPDSTPDAFVDQVDNCNGDDAFSRIFGDLTDLWGPFDHSYPDTLLSDGRLNSSDAPMPSLKIVFNSSGGMGGFDDSVLSDKECVYNRNSDLANGNCVTPGHDVDEAHALYAPYYNTFIPATSRDPFGIASGTDGPIFSDFSGEPNNFPGYGWYGGYHYWDIASVLVQNESVDTNCLLTTNSEDQPIFRQTNGFPTRIVEFTDEHGEARAQWQPGVNNDNFGTTVGFVDDNGGCDLEGVDLGDQTITAAARYPFQPVANDIPATGTIVKHINNLFHKDVTCVRKNNVSSAVAYICTATAQDIAGNGDVFNGESVCFSREPENIWFTVGGSTPHQNGFCVPLAGGTATTPATASVETPGTLIGTPIDVQAYFAGEKLLRDTCIISGQPASTPGPCGGTGGGTSGSTSGSSGSTGGSSGSTGGSSGSTGITTLPAKHNSAKVSKKASVVSVQLVLTKSGRVLMVKVHSAKKTAKIQIRLLNAKGRAISVVVRVVKTNKRVAVPHLRIAKNVKIVKVKVL